jgi:four helix bundle protein
MAWRPSTVKSKKAKVAVLSDVESDNAPDLRKRTFDFAVRIVKLCHYLHEKPGVSRTLAHQLLRAGTAIGASVEEAEAGPGGADLVGQYAMALKEARATHYWLRLLVATEVVAETRLAELLNEADELTRIIGTMIVAAGKTSGEQAAGE